MKVFVYFNLRRKQWSVKALEGERKGRVIAHLDTAILSSCRFKVSEAGRQRVIRERKKNVHAGVIGYLGFSKMPPLSAYRGEAVTYNPYRYATFVRKQDETPIYTADYVTLNRDRSVSAWERL